MNLNLSYLQFFKKYDNINKYLIYAKILLFYFKKLKLNMKLQNLL